MLILLLVLETQVLVLVLETRVLIFVLVLETQVLVLAHVVPFVRASSCQNFWQKSFQTNIVYVRACLDHSLS